MIRNKSIVVVMPAYNSEKTLEATYREIPLEIVDEVVLVDDHSSDATADRAQRLGIRHIIVHEVNQGYGGNQKSCYKLALGLGADIVVMVHPDYQYTPRLVPAMAYMIASGIYPVVLGSRILGGHALKGGMPRYKYFFNRVLTFVQNLLLGAKLSEYHTGYRAFSREVLETVAFEQNSDDFVFDNEMLSQILYLGFDVAEVSCPARYFTDASSINFRRSVKYGLGVLRVSVSYRLQKMGLLHLSRYSSKKALRNEAG